MGFWVQRWTTKSGAVREMTGEDIEDIEDTVPEVAVWLPVPPAGAGS